MITIINNISYFLTINVFIDDPDDHDFFVKESKSEVLINSLSRDIMCFTLTINASTVSSS